MKKRTLALKAETLKNLTLDPAQLAGVIGGGSPSGPSVIQPGTTVMTIGTSGPSVVQPGTTVMTIGTSGPSVISH